MSVLSATTARADGVPNRCGPVLTKCKQALQSRTREVNLCYRALEQSREQSQGLNEELTRANEKLQSPFRNPFLTTLTGAVVGILLIGIVSK